MVDIAAINQLKNPLGNLEGEVSILKIMRKQAGKLNTLHRSKLLMSWCVFIRLLGLAKKGRLIPFFRFLILFIMSSLLKNKIKTTSLFVPILSSVT
jgi:hypothetical protein